MKKTALIGKLIGKNVKVAEASNKSLEGLGGSVTDETKNMIVIKTKKGEKKLIKKQIKLKVI